MNRIKDYACFAACFAGLGYIVLWPITASELGSEPLGAAVFCRDGSAGVFGFLCVDPLRMPAGLHVLGFMSAVFVTARGLAGAIRRSRGSVPAAIAPESADDVPPLRKLRAQPTKLKPRSHFGLRGVPR
jgi:hypothetical protein